MNMGAPSSDELEPSASHHQTRRNDQNPHLIGVQKLVKRLEHARHERRARREPRDGRRRHGKGRQAAAQRMQSDKGGVGDVRLLAGLSAVML